MIDDKRAINPQHVTGVTVANTWAGDHTMIYFIGGSNMMVDATLEDVVTKVNEALELDDVITTLADDRPYFL
jgi:hypothetical protein